MERKLAEAQHDVMQTRGALEQSQADVDYFTNFVNEYLKQVWSCFMISFLTTINLGK